MSTGRRRAPIAPHTMRAEPDAPVQVVRPGTVGYQRAWDLQRTVVARRQAGHGRDALFLLEHPPVYTLGRRTDRSHLLLGPAELARRGIEVAEVDRGGDITYHGPGQLVGYPVLRLGSVRGVVDYVRALEEVLIRVLAGYGLDGERIDGLTGVWVGGAKVAAIGVRVASGGVTSHGFALNVTTDLAGFGGIVPCGIGDREVTSLARLGVATTVDEAADRVEHHLGDLFGVTLVPASLDEVAGAQEVAV